MSESKKVVGEKAASEKQVSRRSMLKWSGGLAAAAAVGAVAGYGLSESGLLKPVTPPPPPPATISLKPPLSPEIQARRDAMVKQWIDRHAGETSTYYSCNTYTRSGSHASLLKVRLKDGVLTAIEPDDTYNPGVAREDENWDNVTKGRLQARSDARWHAYRRMIYDPTRVLYPMKRTNPRGDMHGKLVRITWDEAMDLFASKIKQTIEKYGPYSLYNCEQIFTLPAWFDAGTRGFSIFSSPGSGFTNEIAMAEPGVTGGTGASTGVQVWDMLESTKLIVAWGYTPSEGGDTTPRYYTTLAREKGIPIIGINPRYTTSDETQFNQWIPIRTGTDPAMMLAVANVLIKENLYDKAMVDKMLYGFDKWKDYVMGVTDKVEKTPEWAEPLTGVPAATIREFARYYAKTKPSILVTAGGIQRWTLGENCPWAGFLLAAMTGNMGVLGSGATAKPTGMTSLATPNVAAQWKQTTVTAKGVKFSTSGEGMSVVPVVCAFMRWPDMVLDRAKLDKGEIKALDYSSSIGNTSTNPAPNVRLIFTTHYAVQTLLDINKQVEATKTLDFKVCQRAKLNDPDVRLADLVLPLAEEMEKDPVFKSFPHGFVFADKILKPQGECRGYDWTMVQLAKRMGVDKNYMGIYSEYGDAKWDQMWQDMSKAAYESWASSEAIKPLNPPSWDEFKKKPVFRWERSAAAVAPPMDAHVNKGAKLNTKSGKINAYSDYLAQGTEFLKTTKYGGFIYPYPSYDTTQQFEGFHDTKKPNYPLVCQTPQPKYRTHSWMASNPWLKDELYEHTVLLSVPDAKARGIQGGDLCRVWNDFGEVILRASVSSRLTPGNMVVHKTTYSDPDPVTGADMAANPGYITSQEACPAKTYSHISRCQVAKLSR